jgi:phage gpG-like protein
VSIEFEFKAWAPFHAQYDKRAFKRWLHAVAKESEKAFKKMRGFPPASKPGDYPAVRTGRLRASIRSKVTDDSVEISTDRPYSGFLRHGTRRMNRRKMSDNAMREGIEAAKRRSTKWIGWSR